MLIAAAHPAIYHMTYFQALVIGLIQGVFELFPLSSLGHTVLIPSWIGGNWATLVRQESQPESPYLAFIVGLHLANAIALVIFYIREWVRLVAGFFTSIARRRVATDTERLAWLIVIATIPVGILGLAFEHEFRTLFAKPLAAGLFLFVNGLILLAGERALRSRRGKRDELASALPGEPGQVGRSGRPGANPPAAPGGAGRVAADPAADFEDGGTRFVFDEEAEAQLAGIGLRSAFVIGTAQALALLAGISREGVAMVGGLYRGLTRENALRFAFLLSTPVIFAAGALKIPDLLGPLGNGIRGQVVVGSIAAVFASMAAIAIASRYFRTRTLLPFAAYSLLFGAASSIRFGLF